MGPTVTAPVPPADAPATHAAPRPVAAAALPRISVVTPSFNQGRFLRETMRSVLDQGYPDLQYIVVDGGSTDESPVIIREHAGRLAWWASEKDAGQYDAINKGFARTSGEVMAWLNSDDKYTPWALAVVGEIFAQLPEVQWLTTLLPLHWDARGLPLRCRPVPGFAKARFFRGQYLPRADAYSTHFIQQESTFWRRGLWEKAGGRIDSSLRLAGDFELWAKFYQHADLHGVELPLGGFRIHGDQKTANLQAYIDESLQVLARFGGTPYSRAESALRQGVGGLPVRLLRRAVIARDPYPVCVNQGGRWTVATRFS